MNRNTESRFALTPSVSIGRSTFHRDSSVKTSFNVGQLVPFYCDEVMPGDTFKVKTSKVVRMPMFTTAPMDNMYLDTYYFFVPYRLCWSHFKEFMGENNESAWVPETEYSLPQVTSPNGGWNVGTLADYFGVPTGVSNLSINALPFRAYALIVDQWFRSTVVDDPVNIGIGDSTVAGSNGTNYITDLVKGGVPFVANKYFDLFTACTPAPQRGDDVLIPIASSTAEYEFSGSAGGAVFTNSTLNPLSAFPKGANDRPYNIAYINGAGTSPFSNSYYQTGMYFNVDSELNASVKPNYSFSDVAPIEASTSIDTMIPGNLYCDINDFSGVTLTGGTNLSVGSINQLRLAFQIQKWYEKLAIGGDRYIEIVKQMFGVNSPDARLQRSEYLGGNRTPISIHQVIQQSGTASGTTPQGTPTGQSLTTDVHGDFDHSFTEHGVVIGLCVARYDHSYQQGLDRMWTRKDKFDYYWPVFAHIGNQAIKNSRIYAQGSGAINPDTSKAYDDEVFGYQEAWAEYRYKPNMITGQMRSAYTSSLDVWHWADDYNALPSLSSTWLKEDKSNVDRTLTVGTDVNANQLFADIYVKNKSTRPMPMYSVPGFIDHQ